MFSLSPAWLSTAQSWLDPISTRLRPVSARPSSSPACPTGAIPAQGSTGGFLSGPPGQMPNPDPVDLNAPCAQRWGGGDLCFLFRIPPPSPLNTPTPHSPLCAASGQNASDRQHHAAMRSGRKGRGRLGRGRQAVRRRCLLAPYRFIFGSNRSTNSLPPSGDAGGEENMRLTAVTRRLRHTPNSDTTVCTH